ncbi:MAG TPA: 3'-5' exonuclease [Burkholderiaceae bacterium]|nr:3'-5' exonuclease [Burkholderiaceae bacterium]
MNILAFDIETIPDVDTGRRLYELGELSDQDTGRAMFAIRREETGESEFLKHHLHRVVAISAVLRHGEGMKVWSLGDENSTEAEIIRRFFDGIERYTPTIVSWNGSGFDLPVLHYRSLKHGVSAARYWDTGDNDRDFKWNNYISRYHARHTDLKDVLSAYQPRATAPLDEIAVLLGFPGKMGRSGADVWQQFLDGKLGEIRDYCETDALNTYLVYLRYELIRGNLDDAGFQRESELVRKTLADMNKPHLNEFLSCWK